eukprot:CAMPEP_0184306932 /NCGR_PEP_ID=MMETSP1049-20130417/15807_1 /TAXON_ID=77928 /ORGANISM="Proteomonas sulcata, Strain CCMP704" /LENGTH=221 /DNA_ID=CAMNT_0026619303 /DNA_START=272 /DNA_END=937 /DNA_ORIENTATION=+
MNDDLVQPDRGFATHGHAETEICTYVVQGALTHEDSLGTKQTLGRGSVQYMTAGTGVRHSEHNRDTEKPARFIQMWIVPSERRLQPQYGGMSGDNEESAEKRKNQWFHLVSDVKSSYETPVKINQDANISVTEIGPSFSINLDVKDGRQAYFLCIEGHVEVNGEGVSDWLDPHDAAEIVGPISLTFQAEEEGAHLLVVENEGRGEDSRFRERGEDSASDSD